MLSPKFVVHHLYQRMCCGLTLQTIPTYRVLDEAGVPVRDAIVPEVRYVSRRNQPYTDS